MAKDSWLKLHTALLLSKRYRSLPSNDHRLVFIHHLMFQARGILNDDPVLLACLCNLSLVNYLSILDDLKGTDDKPGLLNPDGSVHDYESKQVTPGALRVRKHRERHNSVTGNVTSNGDADADADAEEEAEKEGGRQSPPATLKQTRMAERILSENGTGLKSWMAKHKISKLLDCHVTEIRTEFGGKSGKQPDGPRPYDADTQDDGPDLTPAERAEGLKALEAAKAKVGLS